MGLRQWGLLLGLSLLWGGSFFFMKIIQIELPVFTIVFLRVSIAALSVYVYLMVLGLYQQQIWPVWRLFIYLAVFNNIIPFSLIVFGLNEIASGLASILNASTPLFTVIVAHFATTDEKFSLHKLIAIVFGMLGVAVLVGFELLSGVGHNVVAVCACLAAGLSYAIASVIGKQLKQYNVAPTSAAFGQIFVSSVLLFPVMLLVDHPWELALPSTHTLIALLGLGVLSSALAYILYFKLIDEAGATNAVLVTLLVPVSASALGYAFLDEVLASNHWFGMALIAIGLLMMDARIINWLKAQRAVKA